MEYIYIAESLSEELCNTIIKKYDTDYSLKNHGFTAGGINQNIKDTTDMVIPIDDIWSDISTTLSSELQKHIELYIYKLNDKPNYTSKYNYGMEYNHLHGNLHVKSNFMIQKYQKEKGKYVYHTDGSNQDNSRRVITYLWYLNDVIEGGETEFFGGSFQIKPKKGHLLLFPSTWTFPHRGNCPLSSDKYIITGWLYQSEQIKPNLEIIPTMSNINLQTDSKLKKNYEDKPEKREFDFLYMYNKKVFQYYKHKHMISKEVQLYTIPVCSWIFQNLKPFQNCEITSSNKLFNYILVTFESFGDIIRSLYEIYALFNITGMYFVNNETTIEYNSEYDLCIQTDLVSGITYVESTYRFISNSLVYFIEFSFDYINDNQEKKNKTVRELSESFLENIDKP